VNTLFTFFVQCLASAFLAKEAPACPEQINVRNDDESLNSVGDAASYIHVSTSTLHKQQSNDAT